LTHGQAAKDANSLVLSIIHIQLEVSGIDGEQKPVNGCFLEV
jgi:hypothetical protein